MKVLVALSGGVDSSVAAALLRAEGHDVTGVTMKLWGGDSDTGCCSVSDVDDARRVAQQLDIDHHVFNFGSAFTADVVEPYVRAHAAGLTPNPCIECNRHLKFDRLLHRARALGFDAIATGHHARVVDVRGRPHVARGRDLRKDQSYVLHMLGAAVLEQVLLPVGHLTKDEVRDRAEALGLRTAGKADSQDVCFITRTGGRATFVGERIPLRPGRVVDGDGQAIGAIDAVELVTVGQRRGLGVSGAGEPRYAIDVDVDSATVTVGSADDLLTSESAVEQLAWASKPAWGPVAVQCSAHGDASAAVIEPGAGTAGIVRWTEPRPRIAPGQSVVFYDGDIVLGGGLAR